MKFKYYICLIATLYIKPLVAQEQYFTDTLKELIAIQTLIAENRIDDFSKFTDDYSYVAGGENFFMKLENKISQGLDQPFFYITKSKGLACGLMRQDSAGNLKLKSTKRELFQIWQVLFKSMEDGLLYPIYKDFREVFENGDDVENRDKVDWKSLGRYKYKSGTKGKEESWTTTTASNFSTMLSTDKELIYMFMGPGKIDYLQIRFPRHNDKQWDDEVKIYFFIDVIKMKWPNNPSNVKEPFNIPFFMSLKNFNDRIWLDN